VTNEDERAGGKVIDSIKINVYKNEKSLSVLNQSEKKIRNKNAFKGMKATQKKHHSGPIKTQFIVDSLGRAKTKRVRKATLFKKAKELFSTTKLDVAVMVLDNKKIDSFFTPNGLLENNIFKNLNKIMPNAISESTIQSATTTASIKEDDDDDEEEGEEEEEDQEDENKKPEVETQVEYEDIEYDKAVCSICNIKIGSKLDRLPSPFLNYSLLKCQRGLCGYNVHNFCIGLGLENEKTLQKLKFLCPKHTYDV
jgi:hypothetical protein